MMTLIAPGAALLGGLVGLAVVLWSWPTDWLRARPRGGLAQADHLVVFALGLGRDAAGDETAGASNDALADWLLANNTDRKPTVVQEGVYLALRERQRRRHREADGPELDLAAWVIRLPHDPAAYVGTVEAALQATSLATARGWSRPAVVAHDLHQQRMAWLFEGYYGADRVVVPALPPTPFDPASTQHWGTRSLAGWRVREILLARPAMGVWGGALLVGVVALAGAVLFGVPAYLLSAAGPR